MTSPPCTANSRPTFPGTSPSWPAALPTGMWSCASSRPSRSSACPEFDAQHVQVVGAEAVIGQPWHDAVVARVHLLEERRHCPSSRPVQIGGLAVDIAGIHA